MSQDKRSRMIVAFISIAASFLILAIKWYSYAITGSAAIKSDAYEGVVNVIAALFALGALVFAEQPADKDHPYGHGKIEYFSAAFEGGLISLAALLICYEAVKAMLGHNEMKELGFGLLVNILAGVLNGLLGWFLISKGRSLHSEAIEADGHHVMSDFYTTVGIAIALGLVYLTGYEWLDPLIALGVGVLLGFTGFKLIKKAAGALLDAEDPGMTVKLVEVMNRHRKNEIIAVHEMKAIRSGRYTHVDVHIVVPEFLTIKEGHDLVEKFCFKVIKEAVVTGEFHPHIDPCERAYCKNCAMENCTIRKEKFETQVPITVESAVELGPNEVYN